MPLSIELIIKVEGDENTLRFDRDVTQVIRGMEAFLERYRPHPEAEKQEDAK